MKSLEQIYRAIEGVTDFTDITIDNPNTEGLFSNRPLHVAAVWGDCEAIRLLVGAGAIIDAPGEHGFTPLMEAAAQGHVDAVKLLVSLGAKPVKDEKGHLPSDWVLEENEALKRYLVEQGF